jgi:SSS family solute:Na+ symporter
VLSAILNAARVSNGTDITSQSDYFADLGDPAVEPAVDAHRPIH